jgi:hypothetical protein
VKQVAEEKVEAAEAAIVALKERVAELEVEANVWREREEVNAPLGQGEIDSLPVLERL